MRESDSSQVDPDLLRDKWRHLILLAMALWFSASAVVPQLESESGVGPARQAWMTMSVQAGFVIGAVLSATLNLADRLPLRALIADFLFAFFLH